MSHLVPRDSSRRGPGDGQGGSLPAIRAALTPQQYQPYQQEVEEAFSIRHYLEILLRRKWLIALVALTFIGVVVINVATTTPLYKAKAVLEYDPSAKIVPYQDLAEQRNQDFLPTQVRKITSRGLAARVARELDLAREPLYQRPVRSGLFMEILLGAKALLQTTLDGAWGSVGGRISSNDPKAATDPQPQVDLAPLLQNLAAWNVRNSNLLEITYVSPDPHFAARVANTVAEEFIKDNIEGRFKAVTKATAVLQAQMEDLRQQLQESERAVIEYARGHDIVDVDRGDSLTRRRFDDLVAGVSEAQRTMALERARYEQLSRTRIEAFPDELRNSEVAGLESKLADVEAQLANLRSRYGPRWPAIRELESARDSLAGQVAAAKRRAIAAAGSDYRQAQARYQRLNAELQSQRAQVDVLNQDLVEFELLQREAETNRSLYEGLLRRLREASVAAGLKSAEIRITEEARAPSSIHSPDRSKALLLSIVMGLCLGIGAAFVAEGLDTTMATSEEVERALKLPALGVIPSLGRNGARRSHPLLRLLGRRPPRDLGPRVAFRNSEPTSHRAWESYRSVRTSILLSHSGKPPQTLLFSSALPGEGKSTTAINLSIALAQTGAKTVLVDLDLRRPALGELFKVQEMEGMSTFLSGNSELSPTMKETPYANLFMVPSGPPAPNPGELIGSERMSLALQLLTEHFSYVVFDTPPALELSDAIVLAPQVDGVVLVIQGNTAPRQAVRKTVQRFQQVGGKILGVILNDVDFRSATYGYYYGSYGDYHTSYYASDRRRGATDSQTGA
ncbi:MAG TPA: polysaccharide biosynthesis tyrosine autokinase [Thermoanaerobaculia bacterium]|nr:polysaccharide biosynthesis tyrosine autokinase [Thermoanaerobaculia bacterium]